ncbi:MAG: 3-hydroxyacyl-ACP dehydratase FabZ [Deltaproteobacteria bacterium]|nr:MAG: 3-hydroxyacyl-ACP dehydratase FabZ [Deltaproteobacteria bacterium]
MTTPERIDIQAVLGMLPHRFPFLFIDGVERVEPERSIVAYHMVSMSNPILQGHFPGRPILPGVVQVEALAQAAVVLASVSGAFDPARHDCLFIGIQEAKFRAPAVPGERLDLEVHALRLGRVGKFEGTVRCGDEVKTTASFTAIIQPKAAAG